MATYSELFDLRFHSALKNRVAIAVVVAAEAIGTESPEPPNHAERLVWAASALANPEAEAGRIHWALLAVNKDLTTTQIVEASDSAIQTQVDAAIDLFATG